MACLCVGGCKETTTWHRVKAATDKRADGQLILCSFCEGVIEDVPRQPVKPNSIAVPDLATDSGFAEAVAKFAS